MLRHGIMIAIILSVLQSIKSQNHTISSRESSLYDAFIQDENGIALYAFTNDKMNGTTCIGICRQDWKPFIVITNYTIALSSGISNNLIGTVNYNNARQITFNNWPLYYCPTDTKFTTKCQGTRYQGGSFQLVSPDGNLNMLTGNKVEAQTCGILNPSCRIRYSTIYLTDNKGVTLYTFSKDNYLKSNCQDCIRDFRPYIVTGIDEVQVGPGVQARLISTTTLDDQKLQLSYNGWPLYVHRAEEGKPGRLGNQGYEKYGGALYLIDIAGNVVTNSNDCEVDNSECICGSQEYNDFISEVSNSFGDSLSLDDVVCNSTMTSTRFSLLLLLVLTTLI